MKKLLFLLVSALFFCVSCTSSAQTDIVLDQQSQMEITVIAVFTNEAASALSAGSAGSDALSNAFDNRVHHRPTISRTDNQVTFSTKVTQEQLPDISDLTGIRSVSVTPGSDTASTSLSIGPATGLVTAIKTWGSTQSESAALIETMLSVTSIKISITYPGSITNSSTPTLTQISTNGNNTTLTAPLTVPLGKWEVIGSTLPNATKSGTWLQAGIIIAVAALFALGWWYFSKRRAQYGKGPNT